MIRYRISDARLRERIKATKANWLTKAAERTADLIDHGGYTSDKLNDRSASSWSDIKSVWRTLQGHTCAYCQKPMAVDHGAVEVDVEHYRPKSKSVAWTPPAGVTATTGRIDGYHWLAYNHWNYCASCKTCNSALKRNYYPVAGTPATGPRPTAVSDMRKEAKRLHTQERPLLLFPIGSVDVNPETIIGWEGVIAVPKGTPGTEEHARGVTTIAFFKLNAREDLVRQRALLISFIWSWHQNGLDSKIKRLLANKKTAMRACGRAFAKRIEADPTSARSLARDAERHLMSM